MVFTHLKFHRIGHPLEYMSFTNHVVEHIVTEFHYEVNEHTEILKYYVVKDEDGNYHHVCGDTFRELKTN